MINQVSIQSFKSVFKVFGIIISANIGRVSSHMKNIEMHLAML